MKFILLINVKMPTIVGILTFISMINTTYERLKGIVGILTFISMINTTYERLKGIVGILTFISMINTTSERLKGRNFFNSFYKQLNISCSVEHEKSFINLGVQIVCKVYEQTTTITASKERVNLPAMLLILFSLPCNQLSPSQAAVGGSGTVALSC